MSTAQDLDIFHSPSLCTRPSARLCPTDYIHKTLKMFEKLYVFLLAYMFIASSEAHIKIFLKLPLTSQKTDAPYQGSKLIMFTDAIAIWYENQTDTDGQLSGRNIALITQPGHKITTVLYTVKNIYMQVKRNLLTNSPRSDSLLKTRRKCCTRHVLRPLVSRYTPPSNGVAYSSTVLFLTTIQNMLLGLLLKTHSAQQGSVTIESSRNIPMTNTATCPQHSVPVMRSQYCCTGILAMSSRR
jgi:hypothetical protein